MSVEDVTIFLLQVFVLGVVLLVSIGIGELVRYLLTDPDEDDDDEEDDDDGSYRELGGEGLNRLRRLRGAPRG